jgi:predicted AAA+ superfamily ATPase
MQSITQSLAGRVGILKLLPFSQSELNAVGMAPSGLDEWLFTGGYPRIYDKGLIPTDFYPDYIQTYLERDVRLLRNIVDLSGFLRFVRLCAGRTGQLLNVSALADACDISAQTVRAWLSVLEASYLVFLVQPYYRNFNKRLTKSPKLYFYDTGLACSLLGIRSSEQLAMHYLRGELFENMVISEYLKHQYAEGVEPRPYFWRDNNETEIDLLVEDGARLKAYEIKSSATMKEHFFKSLDRFSRYADVPLAQKAVVFNGDKIVQTSHGTYLPWRDMNKGQGISAFPPIV